MEIICLEQWDIYNNYFKESVIKMTSNCSLLSITLINITNNNALNWLSIIKSMINIRNIIHASISSVNIGTIQQHNIYYSMDNWQVI